MFKQPHLFYVLEHHLVFYFSRKKVFTLSGRVLTDELTVTTI